MIAYPVKSLLLRRDIGLFVGKNEKNGWSAAVPAGSTRSLCLYIGSLWVSDSIEKFGKYSSTKSTWSTVNTLSLR